MATESRNLRDGQIQVKDNGANTITLVLDNGGLTWGEHRPVNQVMDRGMLDHLRKANEQAVDVKFSMATGRVYAASSPVYLYNALRKIGSAAAWASVGATYEPYMVKVVFTVVDPTGGVANDVITFNRFHYTEISYDEKEDANTISVTGIDHETSPTVA